MKNVIINRSTFSFDYENWLPNEILKDTVLITLFRKDYPLFGKVYVIDDLTSKEAYSVFLEIFTKNEIEKIFAHSEEDFLLLDNLRKAYHIKDAHYPALFDFKNKANMKKIFADCKIPMPSYRVYENIADFGKAAPHIVYPSVLKPIAGAGSKGVRIVHDFEELVKDIDSDSFPLLVEEFINLDLYHADGIFIDNKLKFLSISKYISNSNGVISVLDDGFIGSYMIDSNSPLYKKITDQLHRIKSRCRADVFPFHYEFFYSDNIETPVACEIGARIGGPRIFETIDLVYGVNLHKAWLQSYFKVNQDSVIRKDDTKTGGFVIFTPQRQRLIDFPVRCPVDNIHGFVCRRNRGEFIPSLSDCSSYVFGAIAMASDDKTVLESLSSYYSWLKENIKTNER